MPVQFDDIFKTFDAPTRRAIQQNLVGLRQHARRPRGSALNDTIASLPALFGHLEPVARIPVGSAHRLTRLFNSLDTFMGTVAPVAQTTAQLFTDMATTFEAISRDPNALEDDDRAVALDARRLDRSLQVQQPFLADLTTLGQHLTPGTAAARARRCRVLNPAIEAGTKTLKRTPVAEREPAAADGLR